MKTLLPLITLSTILVCLTASAQTQQRAAGGGLAEPFKQLDRNGDGKVSREEGSSLPFFDAADKHKDGFLTTEEVQAYFAGRRATRPAAASTAPATPSAKTPANAKSVSAASALSPLPITFIRDFQAGTKDTRGQFMGGTETMRLAAHDGNLFAAFGQQRDIVTGVDHVFAGTGAGEVFAGVYDPQAPGRIRWNSQPEYANPDFDGTAFRRCQGFCVAKGKAYASISPSLVERKDGPSPSWHEVFRWKPTGNRAGQGLRGITAVPDPKGGNHEVILGSREQEGRILRTDPLDNYRVDLELQSDAFLREKLGNFRGGKLVAYNRFEPGKDPRTGQPIHWVTVAGVKPGDVQAAWLMIRHTDATYEPVRVFDPSLDPHPLLVSTRTLEFAPWNPREFYTGGFDGAANQRKNHNTAWIFRGQIAYQPAKDSRR